MSAKDVGVEQRREIVRQILAGMSTRKDFAKQFDCSQATIASWVNSGKYGNQAGVADSGESYHVGIAPEDKLAHVIAISGMDDDQLDEYAIEHEITTSALHEWREAALSGLSDKDQSEFSDPVSAMNKAMQQIQRENQALHSRLDKIKNMI